MIEAASAYDSASDDEDDDEGDEGEDEGEEEDGDVVPHGLPPAAAFSPSGDGHDVTVCSNPQTPETPQRQIGGGGGQQQTITIQPPSRPARGGANTTTTSSREGRMILLRAESTVDHLSPPEEVGDVPRYVLQKRLMRAWVEFGEWRHEHMRREVANGLVGDRGYLVMGAAVASGLAFMMQVSWCNGRGGGGGDGRKRRSSSRRRRRRRRRRINTDTQASFIHPLSYYPVLPLPPAATLS